MWSSSYTNTAVKVAWTSHMDVATYRPVFNLTFVSKVIEFERAVTMQLHQYLTDKKSKNKMVKWEQDGHCFKGGDTIPAHTDNMPRRDITHERREYCDAMVPTSLTCSGTVWEFVLSSKPRENSVVWVTGHAQHWQSGSAFPSFRQCCIAAVFSKSWNASPLVAWDFRPQIVVTWANTHLQTT